MRARDPIERAARAAKGDGPYLQAEHAAPKPIDTHAPWGGPWPGDRPDLPDRITVRIGPRPGDLATVPTDTLNLEG